jgi:hypothetical protein
VLLVQRSLHLVAGTLLLQRSHLRCLRLHRRGLSEQSLALLAPPPLLALPLRVVGCALPLLLVPHHRAGGREVVQRRH